jgi:hypothetical protein
VAVDHLGEALVGLEALPLEGLPPVLEETALAPGGASGGLEVMRSSHKVEAWDPNRVLGELDKLIVSAVPEDRPSLVVALAARLAQLGVGLVAPTTNGNGGRATTAVEMPSPFLSTEEANPVNTLPALAGPLFRYRRTF